MNTFIRNSPQRYRVHLQSCILLVILGSLIYGNHLQNPFQFDTVAYITNQHRLDNINEQLNINYLKKEFFHRGLLQISVALNAHLDGFRSFSSRESCIWKPFTESISIRYCCIYNQSTSPG